MWLSIYLMCKDLPYKLISKILVNTLSRTLPDLISPNQCVFVKGRCMNVYAWLKNLWMDIYNNKGTFRREMVAINFTKAFDESYSR